MSTNADINTANPNVETLVATALGVIADLHQRDEELQEQYSDLQQFNTTLGWMRMPGHLAENCRRLKTSLLPDLGRQLDRIAKSADLVVLRLHQDPTNPLQLFIDNLFNLKSSLNAIRAAFPDGDPIRFQRSGNDGSQLPVARYHYVIQQIAKLNDYISNYLYPACSDLMVSIQGSIDNDQEYKEVQPKIISDIHRDVDFANDSIDHLNKWFDLPEFGIVHGIWRQLAQLKIPYNDPSIETKNEILNKMVSVSIPVLKLIRLFFEKLSRYAGTDGSFKQGVKIDSFQMQQLVTESLEIIDDLSNLSCLFQLIEDNQHDMEWEDLVTAGEELAKHVKNFFGFVNSYFLLVLVPNGTPHSNLNEAHRFKQWSYVWYKSFVLAIENLATAE